MEDFPCFMDNFPPIQLPILPPTLPSLSYLNPRIPKLPQSPNKIPPMEQQKSHIPLEELKSFYSTDSYAYARLVISLEFDPEHSKKIVAFWNRLERIHCFRNFVKNLENLSDAYLYQLAYEALNCFHCMDLYKEEQYQWIRPDVPGLEKLANQVISLGLIFPQQELSLKYITNLANNVFENLFSDIFPGTIDKNQNQIEDPDYDPEVNRTLFLTFSKGHPITKQEVHNLFTRKYGDIVETIYMKTTDPEPLYARVVVSSAADVARILGDTGVVNFSYNGKDVRVRKYVY